ncbi:MAG: hypothetical protein ACLRWM_15010 [Streptococcus sp.]
MFQYTLATLSMRTSSINTQMKIEPTNNTDMLTNYVLKLFHNKYTSGAIRSVAVNYSGL